MIKLQIRRKTAKVWQHFITDGENFIFSKCYCKTNGDKFRVVEDGGTQKNEYNFDEIEVYDDLNSGIAETFTSSLELMERLSALNYVGFNQGGNVVIADLISSDSSNAIELGSDDRLFVNKRVAFTFELPHFFFSRYVSTNFSQPVITNGFLTFNVDSGTTNHLTLVPNSNTAIYRVPRTCVLDSVYFYGNISNCEIAIYKSPTAGGTSAVEIYNEIGTSIIEETNINSTIEEDYFIHVFIRNLLNTSGTNSGRLFLKFK
jgi:hypothetical protein